MAVYLDGAHTEAGARALKSFILENNLVPVVLVFACMKDKEGGQIADLLFPLAERIFITRFSYYRAAQPDDILKSAISHQEKISLEPDPLKAFRMAIETAGREKTIVVSGSLFLVGEVKEMLRTGVLAGKR